MNASTRNKWTLANRANLKKNELKHLSLNRYQYWINFTLRTTGNTKRIRFSLHTKDKEEAILRRNAILNTLNKATIYDEDVQKIYSCKNTQLLLLKHSIKHSNNTF